ncbi:hypothetical protein CEH78_001509 [Salmonella enterica]|nr:hypothetical protein [Salmonella enterica]
MKYLPAILLQMVAAVLIVVRAEGALHVLLWCMAVSGVLSSLIPDIKGRISEAYTHCPPWWRFWAFVINTAFFFSIRFAGMVVAGDDSGAESDFRAALLRQDGITP